MQRLVDADLIGAEGAAALQDQKERWDDPAFPRAFPWFEEPKYWEQHVLNLREQIAAMEGRLNRGAAFAVLCSRFLPGTRVLLYVAAGALNVDCPACLTTAAQTRSWGSLKSMYR